MSLRLCELYGLEPCLFDGFLLPPFTDLKHLMSLGRDDIIENILLECGQFKTLHNSPSTFNYELRVWSASRYNIWDDLYKTTVQKYELVHNYDRTEEWSETRKHSESGENGENGTISDSTTTTDTRGGTYNDSGTSSGTTKGEDEKVDDLSVSAYNNGINLAPRESRVVRSDSTGTSSAEHDYTQTATESAENTTVKSGTDSRNGNFSRSGADEFTRTVRAFGNIGVTTTQQMLEEERKLAVFSIVEYIVNDFKNRFCVMIY